MNPEWTVMTMTLFISTLLDDWLNYIGKIVCAGDSVSLGIKRSRRWHGELER
jgi:hypothetical protein